MTFDLSTATAASIEIVTEAAIAMADALVEVSTTARDETFDARIRPLDTAIGLIQDAHGYGPFLANVHPDKDVRDAGNAAKQRLSTWQSDLISRPDVSSSVGAVDAEALHGLELRSHEEWVRDLRRAGHALSSADREDVQSLRNRLIALQVTFAENLAEYRDDLEVSVTDLTDLPDSYVASLEPGATTNTVKVTLDYPSYVPFMEQCPHRDLRRQLQKKYLNRAADVNRPLLEEAIAIRHAIATKLGYADWAEYAMEPKMADPASVEALYDSVIPGLTQLGRRERERLEDLLAEDHPGERLEPWDRQYYHTVQQRRDFGLDHNEVAEYFPLDAVLQGMFAITGEVLGVTYTALPDHPTWHPDVLVYRIDDAASGEPCAFFHLDLHPRDGKFTHAACWDVVNRRRGGDGMLRLPVAAVAANFTKPTRDAPSLLKHSEALTLWHEFGHVLHACLTEIDVQRFAGFETEWDFVEAPSQIMENWMWRPEVLTRFARHHETGTPVPDAMVEGLTSARDHNIGLLTLRQVFLGRYDLAMHTTGPSPDLEALQGQTNDYTLLPLHDDTFMAASFGHVMGGYDAGYYGYLWANVYGDDMFSVFEDEGVLSPAVGRRYRTDVLAMGSARPAWEHLRAFLGREPNAVAFLRKLGI